MSVGSRVSVMALGTPFDRLELGVLVGVAGVFSLAQPVLVPSGPIAGLAYLFLAGGASVLSAALVRSVRRRSADE